ncbi:MAG TPA: hypothetical protein DD437_02835 [Rhodobiaceae bacterium]|nr:hypothetical protein [Rhodobiaceae bacterium]|tara:strand:- start:1271 stop:2173 length:903 start_codon:yes stop_codon:yes gene_type:complete
MKNSNDLHLGVAIGFAVTLLIIGVWGIFATTEGWQRSDFINILVAIGTIGATVGAFWGVRAARRTQEREWKRQDDIVALDRARIQEAQFVNVYAQIQRCAIQLLAIAQEIDLAFMGLLEAEEDGDDERISWAVSVCLRIADQPYAGSLSALVPSAAETTKLVEVNDDGVRREVLKFSANVEGAIYKLNGLQAACRERNRFSKNDILAFALIALDVALTAEAFRVNKGFEFEQWAGISSAANLALGDEWPNDKQFTTEEINVLRRRTSAAFQHRKHRWQAEVDRISKGVSYEPDRPAHREQ